MENENIENIPAITIDLMRDEYQNCSKIFVDDALPFIKLTNTNPAAWLPISISWNELWKQISKRTREYYRDTERKGYYCEIFVPSEHIQEIHDINHSKTERQGRPMGKWYQSSVEELTRDLCSFNSLNVYKCPLHYKIWIGIFTKEKKLVGYIAFRRVGQFSVYTTILGHSDYLKDNIMGFLHFYIQKLIRESNDEHFKGIIGTAYYLWKSGKTDTLQFWKHKVGFASYCLEIKGDSK
jgi:L-amino acid N-acyltransferase YncA